MRQGSIYEMNAEDRRLKNIARYEARVRQVKRIKRTMIAVAAAAVVGIVAIVSVSGRKSTKAVQTADMNQNNTVTPDAGTVVAASSAGAVTGVSAQPVQSASSASSATSTSLVSAAQPTSSAASSSAAASSSGVFGTVGRTIVQAANEGEKAVNTAKYIWASPKGATEGNKNDPVPENDPSLQEGTKKIIYLTFDDGPGQYTEQLLGILAKHNAKATFFVTNQFPKYQNLIKREAEEGHSIAVHSYLHDYKTIYSSTEQYWEDFEKMQQVIEEQTGYRTELVRFPGGSSNTISHFTPGIMTELAKEVEEKGYTYIDWNASSGDGEAHTSRESVLADSEKQCSYSDTSVLLCHDIKQSTVDAMDEFLTWGEQNGYTFLPMSPHSKSCHQQINN
jgi:peptidoglycan/xylan/chitin deacetylase (PgdA/CDA1 family)